MIEQFDNVVEAGWLHDKASAQAQAAATLAAFTLNELQPAYPSRSEMINHERSASHGSERAGVAD
jgi:hypothetical protein